MKTKTHKAILLLLSCASFFAYGEEVVQSKYGDLSIVGDFQNNTLLFNGHELMLPSGDESVSLSFISETPYKTSNGDVFLIGESSGASCQLYRFVTLSKQTNPKVSLAFGSCDDDPKISQKGNTIMLKMKNSDAQTETYMYQNGVVTLNGNPIE